MKKIDFDNFKGATSRTARDINRRIVLNLVRQRQPISRAELARHSGLQRSTISVIASQLIAERWVLEGSVGHLPRGRNPIFLLLNPKRIGVIGITVRPVTTAIALAGADLSFIAQTSLPTTGTSRQFTEQLCERVQAVIKTHPDITIEGIGLSLPGRVDSRSQKLTFAPNLKWHDLDLKPPLENATGLPVVLENAANACALAEFSSTAGRPWRSPAAVSNPDRAISGCEQSPVFVSAGPGGLDPMPSMVMSGCVLITAWTRLAIIVR